MGRTIQVAKPKRGPVDAPVKEESPRQRAKREGKPYIKVIVDTRWSDGGWCWEAEGPVDAECRELGEALLSTLAGQASPLRELKARLADAEGEGCTLHGHAPHGQEAEELRKGVEEALAYGTHAEIRDHLQELLDRVPARDSLTHLRANEELAEARAKVGEFERLFAGAGERYAAAKERIAELEKYAADVEVDLVFNGKLMGLLASAEGARREYDDTTTPEHQRRVNEAFELVLADVRKINGPAKTAGEA